ncbi:O-methyltransferase [Macleaya cordata]|uniref:O-methyltransferase n=1 Tax=Macleaya cordata TaxID=56857 RepID=A0A200PY03_MACCD|nr:O-methyltransferase [Macleaya cordata]
MDSTAQEMKKNELVQAQAHVFNNICGFFSSMSLKCAVELGIPDIIHNHGKPMPLSDLVEALSLPPSKTENVYRLMRLLVHSGLFAKQKIDENQDEEGYLLTTSSNFLLHNTEFSLADFVINLVNPALVKPGHILSDWFRTGESTAFEAVHGVPFWRHLMQNPEYEKGFSNIMAANSKLVMSDIVNSCKSVFENLRSVVDVGGGTGTSARVIVEAFPHLKCLVLDLPNLVANLPGNSNLEFIGGDMFESIPRADAIILKHVLHNWGDDESLKILKSCREAIPSKKEGGKVIVIEIVVEEDSKLENDQLTKTQLYFDMLMMTTFNGKERSEKQWEKLFLEAGFSDYKITTLSGFSSLIEVFP